MTDWNKRYIELAQLVALWSKDPTTKVGAVAIGLDPRNIALGFNGFPPGINDDDRLHDRAIKHRLIQHAERNVLDNARFDLTGATIVTTRFPCHGCAKSIVTRGIVRVVCPLMPVDPIWKESSDWAHKILNEARVWIDIQSF